MTVRTISLDVYILWIAVLPNRLMRYFPMNRFSPLMPLYIPPKMLINQSCLMLVAIFPFWMNTINESCVKHWKGLIHMSEAKQGKKA